MPDLEKELRASRERGRKILIPYLMGGMTEDWGQSLAAVVAAGKCKAGLQDPWHHDYVYLYPGQVHADSFDIKSYGADGQPGGEGEAADIVNQ